MRKDFLYEKEITIILENNSVERNNEIYGRIIEKLESLNGRMNKISLYLIICVCVYPLASTNDLISVSIGPFGLKDFSWIAKSIPVVFAYLCLEYALASSHQRQLAEVCKQFIVNLYNDVPNAEIIVKGNYVSFLSNVLMPFTLFTQISRLINLKGSVLTAIIIFFLWLPLMIIFFLPLVIEIFLLRDLWNKYHGDLWTVLSIAVSSWFFLIIIIYFIRHVEHDRKSGR